jgi:hypothetical protein
MVTLSKGCEYFRDEATRILDKRLQARTVPAPTLNHLAAAIIAFRKVHLKINIIYG